MSAAYTTLNAALKLGIEVCAYGTVIMAVSQVMAPGQQYYDKLKESSTAIFEQSESLEAEFSVVLSEIENIYYAKLSSASRLTSGTGANGTGSIRREIAREDLDEFCRNITDENTFADILRGRKEVLPATFTNKVNEKYRIIPISELQRLRDAAVILEEKSKPPVVKRSWYGRGEIINEKVVEKSSLTEVLEAVYGISHLVEGYAKRFEREQDRLQRAIYTKAAELRTPDEALSETRRLVIAQAIGYTAFCVVMDKIDPLTKPFSPLPRTTFVRAALIYGGMTYAYFKLNALDQEWARKRDIVENSKIFRRSSDTSRNVALYSNYFHPPPAPPVKVEADEERTVIGTFFNFFLGDETESDEKAEIPKIWAGATLRDPFKAQRLTMECFIKPLSDAVLIYGVLFNRLVACGGIPFAMIMTPLIYTFDDDLSTAMNHYTFEESLYENIFKGFLYSTLYCATGRLWPVLFLSMHSQIDLLIQEYRTRGDIIKETLEMYPFIQKISVLLALDVYSHQLIQLYMIKNGIRKDIPGISIDKGKPHNDVIKFTDKIISNFGTVNQNNQNNESNERDNDPKAKVMSPEDMYDFLEAFLHVTENDETKSMKKGSQTFKDIYCIPSNFVPAVALRHQSHYSNYVKIPNMGNGFGFRRDIAIKGMLKDTFKDGFTRDQASDFIMMQCLASQYGVAGNKLGNKIDFYKIENQILKWENSVNPNKTSKNNSNTNNNDNTNNNKNNKINSNIYNNPTEDSDKYDFTHDNDEKFLDLMDSVYKGLLNQVEVEAVKFGIWRSAEFLEGLAGRKAGPEDMKKYHEELRQWIEYACKRAAVDSLLPYGITTKRYSKLIRMYIERDQDSADKDQDTPESNHRNEKIEKNEILKLKKQWEDYFQGNVFGITLIKHEIGSLL